MYKRIMNKYEHYCRMLCIAVWAERTAITYILVLYSEEES